MRKVFDELHHHGKKAYKHAQKHHKKYLWGAAGFFGLFKLFAFLIASISGIFTYATLASDTPSIISIAIPATTIDIQEGETIIQFDLSEVDIGNYNDIQDIDIRMDIETPKQVVDIETLRNSTATNIGQQDISNTLTLQFRKTTENTRTIERDQLPQIIDQLSTGNTIVYLLPQEYINIGNGTIFMEVEAIKSTPTETMQNETGGLLKEDGKVQNETGEISYETMEGQSGIGESSEEIIQESINIKKEKKLISNAKTLKDIALFSENKKIHIKIPKETKIKTKDNKNFEGTINQPKEIALDTLISKPETKGIYAFEVGDPEQSIFFKKNDNTQQNIDITIYIDSLDIFSGEQVNIYYSEDQNTRNILGNSIVQKDEEGKLYVHILVDHMTTFYIGKDLPENQFHFFLSDSSCDEDMDIILRDGKETRPVYVCTTGENIANIVSMKISNISAEDANGKERNEFSTPYNDFKYFGLDTSKGRGQTTMYAQYRDKNGNIGTVEDQIIVTRDDDISFFIAEDGGCETPITSATDQSIVYLCTQGTDQESANDLRISSISQKDLVKQSWLGNYNSAYEFTLSGEGSTTIYTEYIYGTDPQYRSEIASNTITVKKTSTATTTLGGTVMNGGTLDVTNKYRTINSSDGISKITLDTADTTSTITVSRSTRDGTLSAPSLITAGTKKANAGEAGLDIHFVPSKTYEVGDDVAGLSLSNAEFAISLYTTETIGARLNIYSSQDGTTWTNENKICTVTANHTCDFTTTHLTLFTIGTTAGITWNNMEFVNQDFRDANPSSSEIIKAFFGSGNDRSAYTFHRGRSYLPSAGYVPCIPTTVTYLNPGTRSAFTVPTNTIYILNSGTYLQNGTITLSKCSALIGKGIVTINKTTTASIVSSSTGDRIVDNIQMNGSGYTSYLAYSNGQNFTFNDIQGYNCNDANYCILFSATKNTLINNSQFYNNAGRVDIRNAGAEYNVINNCQFFNNSNTQGYVLLLNNINSSINNSQSYNNANDGFRIYNSTGTILNNIQANNNARYGLYLQNSWATNVHAIKVFNNREDIASIYGPSTTSGKYRGKNIIDERYSRTLTPGTANSSLGRSAGSVVQPGIPQSGCNYITNPYNGYGTGLLDIEYNCMRGIPFATGRIASWTSQPIVKYLYANQMTGTAYNFTPRQIHPVVRQNASTGAYLTATEGYHGHRFIGEYYDPSGRDLNPPVVLFTGETPPEGENVMMGAYSGYFTVRSYIYEPNLSNLQRYTTTPTGSSVTYSIYDSGLIFMANFDQVEEIGESSTVIKDLSPYKNFGAPTTNVLRTGYGQRNGAYKFPTTPTTGRIWFSVPSTTSALNPDYISIFAWVKPGSSSVNKNIVSRMNAIYRVRLNGSSNYMERAYLKSSGASSFCSRTETTLPVPANKRSFVGWSYNGTTYSFYLNTGYGLVTKTYGGTINCTGVLAKTTDPLYIGAARSSSEASADMVMDEIRMYNRTLTNGEIEHLYNSNLSSKPDHREYVVNYTGVQSRQAQTKYIYGFNTTSPITDNDGNTLTATGSVVKFGCDRAANPPRRNNNNYLTGSFRTHSPAPTDCDIIAALYGTGTNGSDLTAYTNSWNSWTNQCSHQNMAVVYLNPGTNQIPDLLNANTIYVLSPGNYLQTGTNAIDVNDCNAIIATTGTARIYSTTATNIIYGNSDYYFILDNIEVDGTSTNSNGVFMSSCENDTFNNCRIHDFKADGIYFSKSPHKKISNSIINKNASDGIVNNSTTDYVLIENTTINDNGADGISEGDSSYFVFSGLQIFNNGSDGIFIVGTLSGIIINSNIYSNTVYGINNRSARYIYVANNYVYNNGAGIYINGSSSNNNIYSGLQIYNNDNYGICFNGNGTNTHTIDNTQIYSNQTGIGINGDNSYITINNIQIFNNSYGISTDAINYKDYISLNNSQIYNNANDGILLYYTRYFTVNNSHIYNNSGNGIYFASTNNNSGIINNSFIYDNANYGIRIVGGSHIDYGPLTMFDNGSNILGSISYGNNITYSSLGWTGGYANFTGCMNCSRVTNPIDTTIGNFINTTAYPKCNMKGSTLWTGGSGLYYTYGINLTGQKQPVYRNSTTLSLSALGYSGSKYVAETNKIETYNNTTCSCVGHSFRRGNDAFLNSGFRNNNPNYCDIIAALYGESLDGSDETAYTYTRSGFSEPRSNQCNIENMNVTYLTGGTGKISMAPQTIYVLAGGTYIQTGTIGMNECTAIVGTGLWNSNTSLRSTAQIGSTIATQQFTVVDNISINGTGGGVVPAHTANSYGISIGSNSTINNASIYNNSIGMVGGPGITRSSTNNTSIHDNISHGIRLYNNSHYNTINNIQAYNNLNGIYIVNTSNYTTINNTQTYNNANAGMSIRSLYTKINNSQVFNNERYGIELTSYGDYTNINNTRIYNNTTGLYIDPLAINGKYYGTNRIFANSVDDIGGSGENFSTGLSTDYPLLGWSNGQMLETGILGRDIITNPKNNSGEFLVPFTGYSFTGLIGEKTFNIIEPIIYSYGSGIRTQAQPVYHDGIPLITGGAFNGDRFIGSNTKKITGDLLLPIAISSSGITVTGISSSPLVTRYAVRGNIANIYSNMNLGTSTGIFLDDSVFGAKRIVTFLYKQPSTDGFLMHFEKQVEYNKCLSGRDNNNFIDETFRAMNPTDDNIICAIYGSEDDTDTAYTHTWPGYDHTVCLDAGMTVEYASNPNSIPLGGMAANTVYIFPSGDYDLPSQIELKSCVAFISSGTTSIGNGGNNFYITAYDYDVIDNIHLNAESYSDIGIILGGTKGSTLHNMDIFRANDRGIRIKGGKFNLIDTLNIYNNTRYGIYFDNAGNNTINNTQTYNNSAYGMYIDNNSTYNSINNTAIYNNDGDGIAEYGDRTIVNNVDIFNHRGNGFYSEGSNMVIANVMAYNNRAYGFNFQGGGMLYYGDNFAFNNGDGQYNLASASQGTAIPAYGWTDGMLYDSDGNYSYIPNLISRDYIINPKNSKFGYTGEYLFSWGDDFGNIRGVFGFDETFTPIDYSYGSGILGQKLPIYRNDTPNMTTGLLFDSGRYIGSRTPIYTGTLTLPATTSITSITVTGIANASQISGYNLFGIDIANPYIMKPINTATSISLIGGDGIKTLITQLYHSGYFATHFQSTTTLNATIDCASRWNNDNFITGAFRAGNPTDENIICALYGTGPGDKTAYTYLRTGRNTTQCSGIQMNVIYTGKLSSSTLASNTIYVMTGGYSTGNDTITVANCSAIISKNSTGTLFQSTRGLSNGSFSTVYANKYIIFDNLTINATGGGLVPAHTQNAYGIHIFYGGNVTINNIRGLYANEGIRISSAEYNNINNTELYRNEKGIIVNPGTNTFVNNTQIYNNNMAAWYLAGGYNTINNSQIYNNGNGITYSNSNYNIINNTQIYNNNANSISVSGTGNIINNIRLYNDNLGIYIDAGAVNTKYYGINRFFDNSNNINGTLITGSSSDYPGIFTNGSLNTTNTISRDYITNPLNANGSYLLSWTGTWAGAKGVKSFAEVLPIKYSYGSGIITQTQPVYFSGTALKTGGMFDTTKYIGSDTTKVTGYLAGMPTIISGTSRTISGNTSSSLINRYSVFGNITTYKIGQTKNTNTGILLTAGDGTKKIITQFYSTTYFATHFETDVLLDTIAPTFTFNNDSTTEANPLSLTVTAATDTGSGLPASPYNFSYNNSVRSGRQASANFSLGTQNEPLSIGLRAKVRDVAGNESIAQLATGTRNNVAPTATAVNATGLESTNITLTGSATDPGGSTLTYVRYSNATCTSFLYTGQGYTSMQNEPATVNYYYKAYDAQRLGSACTTGTATRTNTGPVNTSLTNNGPTGENSTITRTASAIDTGNTMVYVRYSGYSCNTLLGTGTSTTGYTMSDPGSLARSIRIYDTQGSGGVCIGSTGIRINTTLDCLGTRNNDNFISGAFWNLNPSDDNVICALYGSGIGDITAYTQFRSGRDTTQCSGVAMNVIYTGKLSLSTLDSNTIYVMTGTYSTGSDTIMVANCSAIISKNNTGTLFQSTTGLSNGSFSTVHGNKYIIFDNLTINGTGGGLVPAHTQNAYGIHIFYGGNVTINNIRCSYTNEGIRLSLSANYNSINNSEVYKNDKGVITNPGINTLINNTKIYNNNLAVWIIAGGYNTINNSQIYNNGNSIAYSNSNYNIINNTQIYNNHGGISISGTGNILHNIRSYNNDQGINIDPGAVNTKYYGINRFFDNSNDINGTLITGSSSEYPGIFTDGLLDTTDIISRDYITNPINNNGNYLLPWTGTWAGIKGTKSFDEILPIKYSYGSGIVTQIQPVYYSGTTLTTGGLFDTTKYIGSETTKVTGELIGLDTINNMTVTVTGTSPSTSIQTYSIFGDIDSYIVGTPKNTSTNITFTQSIGIKRIITQLSGNNYFATHFENDIEVFAPIIYFTGSTPANGSTGYFNNFKPQIEMITTGGMNSFIYTFNGINYSYYDSGLILMMNFDKRSSLNETDGMMKDFSRYSNYGSGYNGITWTNNGWRNGGYEFDGLDDRIQIANKTGLQVTKFTISAWIKPIGTGSAGGIFSTFYYKGLANYYGYMARLQPDNQINFGTFNGGGWNTTNTLLGPIIQTGTYTFVTFTFDGTNGNIFINGTYSTGKALPTPTYDSIEYHADIGTVHSAGGAYGSLFSGIIDEVRIRNRALTSGEIYQMRRSNLTKIEENKWLFTDDRQCVVDNTYIYTGYVKNMYGMSANTGRTNIVDILNPTPYAPVGYFIGSTGVAGTSRILSGQFTGHFKLEDREGTTGWYTTIMFPIVMSGTTYSANAINWDKISFWATGAETISGTSTTQVYVTGSLATPQSTSGAVKYIIRDFVEGYSCPAGVYGNKPYISVDIPARQSPDTYSGLVTIDINN